jgi:glycosyltransferase involved in cell wall biosynthesis
VRHCATLFESFRNNGCQVYFVVYDLLPLLFPQFFPPGVSNIHDEWMMVAAQCDGAICISRAVSGDVLKWLDKVQPFRCRPFSIGWFPLGADIENSLPTKGLPEGFDADLQKFAASPTILMVGTIEPRKGHDQVVKACELLWMTGMKLNLVIVGKKGCYHDWKSINNSTAGFSGIRASAMRR